MSSLRIFWATAGNALQWPLCVYFNTLRSCVFLFIMAIWSAAVPLLDGRFFKGLLKFLEMLPQHFLFLLKRTCSIHPKSSGPLGNLQEI